MVNGQRTIKKKIVYSKGVLTSIIDLTNENPFGKTSITRIVGELKLDGNNEYLIITYTGREDIVRRLEEYTRMVNDDGSHEAMVAALIFKTEGQN